ncbi:MAG: polyphosphate kinase 1 [Planctomycetota bacterium]|nr:polyphosphate kinase 1 [Planctomycetota bacterium]
MTASRDRDSDLPGGAPEIAAADDAPAPAPAPAKPSKRTKSGSLHVAASRAHWGGLPAAPTTAPAAEDLSAPENFINRELSLLEFNRRVLMQAKDQSLPVLERLRFLAICSSNLDEFFEIRVAGLKEKITYDLGWTGPDRTPPREILRKVSERAHGLVAEQYRVLDDEIRPALEAEGIEALRHTGWTQRQKQWIQRYFRSEALPILTPIAIDPAHPFPKVLNKGLSFLVELEGKDAYGRASGVAVVQVPRSLPRVVRLPRSLSRAPHTYVLLTSIIQEHVGELFPGMHVYGCHQFRITRNSDLWVDEEEVENLLHALKGELPSRRYGEAVRLEVHENCPEEMVAYLRQETRLAEDDVYRVNGPVNLHRLSGIYDHSDRDDLKYTPFLPGLAKRLRRHKSIFEAIKRRDVLLHHPYQQFSPILDLLREAATDPDVIALKMTLYRVGDKSPVVEALLDAARHGKEVTALVELRARFDEEANIDLATRLEEVGVNVVYGIVGYKAHTKLLMIVRRERGRIRRYVHCGTGNYHAGTARAYTDFGLMTADAEIGEDVHHIFMQLTGLGKAAKLQKLLQSPFTLHKGLLRMIRQEAKNARAGKPARIMAKMNSLSEPETIQALYAASQAGVQIDLVIRGICCLRPGVPGLSDNIRVRSIVGRFLEHHRVYYFHAGGKELVFCSSADWMSRNLKRRVEQAFPVLDAKAKLRVLREGLEIYWRDNQQAWDLQSDGSYVRAAAKAGDEPYCSQRRLLELLAR